MLVEPCLAHGVEFVTKSGRGGWLSESDEKWQWWHGLRRCACARSCIEHFTNPIFSCFAAQQSSCQTHCMGKEWHSAITGTGASWEPLAARGQSSEYLREGGLTEWRCVERDLGSKQSLLTEGWQLLFWAQGWQVAVAQWLHLLHVGYRGSKQLWPQCTLSHNLDFSRTVTFLCPWSPSNQANPHSVSTTSLRSSSPATVTLRDSHMYMLATGFALITVIPLQSSSN